MHHRTQPFAVSTSERHGVFASTQLDGLDRQRGYLRRRQRPIRIEHDNAFFRERNSRTAWTCFQYIHRKVESRKAISQPVQSRTTLARVVMNQATHCIQPNVPRGGHKYAAHLHRRQSFLNRNTFMQAQLHTIPMIAFNAAETRYPYLARRREIKAVDIFSWRQRNTNKSLPIQAPKIFTIAIPWHTIWRKSQINKGLCFFAQRFFRRKLFDLISIL